MSAHEIARRAVIAGCGAFALVPMVAAGGALAQQRPAARDIRVDVSPLRANVGDPTAAWVEQELPRRLAQALASRLTPRGGTLVVRIDDLALGPNKDSSARDNIGGVATIGGVQWPVRATAKYRASPVDQTMIAQSNHDRISQLVQALAYWIARDL